MSNKIETGCKARIVNSRAGNDGIIVTVGSYIGDVYGFFPGSRWEIDVFVMSIQGAKNNHVAEFQLERIDYDGDEKSSWESMKDIWSPAQVVEM